MNRMTNWQLIKMDKFILEINYNVKNWTEIKLYKRTFNLDLGKPWISYSCRHFRTIESRTFTLDHE